MRTTLDIDDPVLRDLKKLQKRERKSMGRLVSDLLAAALGQMRAEKPRARAFRWVSRPMKARVDLANRDAIVEAMDEPRSGSREGFWQTYRGVVEEVPVRGNLVPDAHLAALLRQHGVSVLYTLDRDFHKFRFLEVRDPLTG